LVLPTAQELAAMTNAEFSAYMEKLCKARGIEFLRNSGKRGAETWTGTWQDDDDENKRQIDQETLPDFLEEAVQEVDPDCLARHPDEQDEWDQLPDGYKDHLMKAFVHAAEKDRILVHTAGRSRALMTRFIAKKIPRSTCSG
jgi:hypothetical protein